MITGLIMQTPSVRHSGNGFFTIHRDSDILIGTLALAFWLVMTTRRSGTEAGLLFPWLKADRRAGRLLNPSQRAQMTTGLRSLLDERPVAGHFRKPSR